MFKAGRSWAIMMRDPLPITHALSIVISLCFMVFITLVINDIIYLHIYYLSAVLQYKLQEDGRTVSLGHYCILIPMNTIKKQNSTA